MTSATPPSIPAPATSVVPVRDGPDGPEVLLMRRPATMAFGPGLHVFPGGRVDARDADPAWDALGGLDAGEAGRRLGLLPSRAALAHLVAGLRELAEEAGILAACRPEAPDQPPAPADAARIVARLRFGGEGGRLDALLARAGLRPATDRLVHLGRWVTPPSLPRRFDVRFLALAVDAATAVDPDPDETDGFAWVRPADALAARSRGAMELWLPTAATLAALARLRSTADLGCTVGGRPWTTTPAGVVRVAADHVKLHAGNAHGGGPTDPAAGVTDLIGRRAPLVIDPGDPDPAFADAVLAEAARAGGRPAAILVTGLEPERIAGVDELVDRCGMPVLAAPDALPWLPFAAQPVVGGPLGVGDAAVRIVALEGPRVVVRVGRG